MLRTVKVIFLDFDGVLITRESYAERNRIIQSGEPFLGQVEADPVCVGYLNILLAVHPEARICVSSTHRMGQNRVQLQERITGWGVKGTVIGATPFLIKDTVHQTRGSESHAWLDEMDEVYDIESVCDAHWEESLMTEKPEHFWISIEAVEDQKRRRVKPTFCLVNGRVRQYAHFPPSRNPLPFTRSARYVGAGIKCKEGD